MAALQGAKDALRMLFHPAAHRRFLVEHVKPYAERRIAFVAVCVTMIIVSLWLTVIQNARRCAHLRLQNGVWIEKPDDPACKCEHRGDAGAGVFLSSLLLAVALYWLVLGMIAGIGRVGFTHRVYTTTTTYTVPMPRVEQQWVRYSGGRGPW